MKGYGICLIPSTTNITIPKWCMTLWQRMVSEGWLDSELFLQMASQSLGDSHLKSSEKLGTHCEYFLKSMGHEWKCTVCMWEILMYVVGMLASAVEESTSSSNIS